MTSNITESASHYDDLETFSVEDCLLGINEQDKTLPDKIKQTIPAQTQLITAIVSRMREGGRLLYVGAGTSGRLGVLDAAECPPTFGMAPDRVVGIMAGGDAALVSAVEFVEDDAVQAKNDMQRYALNQHDTVIGISASGGAKYVLAAMENARDAGALTGCITCNVDTALAEYVDHPLVCVVGPEFVTGSTRMKAGTITKLILNMISTTVMIQLGHVKGNQMVDMQLNNQKLHQRAVNMLVGRLGIDEQAASTLLEKHGSVRAVLDCSDPS